MESNTATMSRISVPARECVTPSRLVQGLAYPADAAPLCEFERILLHPTSVLVRPQKHLLHSEDNRISPARAGQRRADDGARGLPSDTLTRKRESSRYGPEGQTRPGLAAYLDRHCGRAQERCR